MIDILEEEEEQELEPKVLEHIRAVGNQLGRMCAYDPGKAYELFNASNKGALEIALTKLFRNAFTTFASGHRIGHNLVKVTIRGKSVEIMPFGKERVEMIHAAIAPGTYKAIVRAFTIFIAIGAAQELGGIGTKGDK